MDIKFNLLIVDDDIRDDEDPIYQKLEDLIRDMNLIPKIKLSNGLDYKQIVKSEDFDLYLIDYNLVSNIEGQQVIKEIRDNNKSLTDIILYSTTSEDLYKKVIEYKLDGVYICQRRDLVLKTKKILEKLEKRMLNPLSLRGIVLHNFSDIEFKLREALLRIYKNMDETGRSSVEQETKNIIENGKGNFNQKIILCLENGNFFEDLFHDKNYLFDMGKKINLLNFLKKKDYVNLTKRDIKLLYSLNDIRNELGHAQIKSEDGTMVITNIKNERKVYDAQKCKDIKKEIISAMEILQLI